MKPEFVEIREEIFITGMGRNSKGQNVVKFNVNYSEDSVFSKDLSHMEEDRNYFPTNTKVGDSFYWCWHYEPLPKKKNAKISNESFE